MIGISKRLSKHEQRMKRLNEKKHNKHNQDKINSKTEKASNLKNTAIAILSVIIIAMFIFSNTKVVLPTNGDDPMLGSVDAPITIIAFGDFQCPYTRNFARKTLNQLMTKYDGQINLVYKDYPKTAEKNHVYAQKASEAAECAGDQGKYWEYFNILFETNYLDINSLKNHATTLDLDRTTFDQCLSSGKYRDEVLDDYKEGKRAGVTTTPTFFINGYKLAGDHPLSSFDAVIEAMG